MHNEPMHDAHTAALRTPGVVAVVMIFDEGGDVRMDAAIDAGVDPVAVAAALRIQADRLEAGGAALTPGRGCCASALDEPHELACPVAQS